MEGSGIPFRQTKLLVFEENFPTRLSAYTDHAMFAKVKAVVTCSGLCTGTLAESPSFGDKAQGTHNWVVLTDQLRRLGWERKAGQQITYAGNEGNSDDDEEPKSSTGQIGLQ